MRLLPRFLPILLLAATFAVANPPEAKACVGIPVISQLCNIITGGSLLDAVKSRVMIYVESMMTTLKIDSTQKYTKAEALLEQRAAIANGQRQVQRDFEPAVDGVRCKVASDASTVFRGGDATPPSLKDPDKAVPPSLQSAVSKAADAAAAVKARPPLPDPNDTSTGEPQPVGPGLPRDTSGYDFASFQNTLVERQARASQNRRDNNTPGSQDQLQAVLFDYNMRQSNFGPNQPVESFRDADISAPTILLTDTFPADLNKPTPASFTVGKNTVTVAPRTMLDAANAYCSNLVDPTILGPNRGAALGENTDRKAYAVERAGWSARQSLASTICQQMVAKRTGKTVNSDSGQGLVKIMLAYRADACKSDQVADKKYLDCPSAAVLADPKAVAADGAKFAVRFSEHEMMKILYSALLPSLQGAQLMGSAGGTDTLGNLLQVDQLALTLNFRIYEMQEKLNLIKAAQLAQLVENTKSSPGASGPSR